MVAEEWDVLVRRLEERAGTDPRGHRWRVAALAMLGYVYIAAVLVLLVAATVAVGVVTLKTPAFAKLGIPIAVVIGLVVRSLFVRIPPPDGIEIRNGDGALRREVEHVRTELDAPRIHKVLVDGDLNASIAQIPRFGVFGPTRNYLVLGLPLLQALSLDEFRAVLAHELAHVSRRHGRVATSVYRLRRTWSALLERLERSGRRGSFLFTRFFRWYAPTFDAYSQVLARRHEYEADAAAASVAGADAVGGSLAKGEVAADHLGRTFWPDVYARVDHAPQPGRPFASVAASLRTACESPDADEVVRRALADEGDPAASHPPLRARLDALGIAPEALDVSGSAGTAADVLLGDDQRALADELDRGWAEAVADEWRMRHGEAREARSRLEALSARPVETLADDELADLAVFTDRFRGMDSALPLYEAVVARSPGEPRANFALGEALLAKGDERGLEYLDRAIASEPAAVLPACAMARSFLSERGRDEEAKRYDERAQQHLEVLDEAASERETLTADELVEHGLPADRVAAIRDVVARQKTVKRAYLGSKRVAHFADVDPVLAVGVVRKQQTFRLAKLDADATLVDELYEELSPFGVSFVVLFDGDFRALEKAFKRLPGGEIFRR